MNAIDKAVSFTLSRVAFARREWQKAVGRGGGLPMPLSGDAPLTIFGGLDDDAQRRTALTQSWIYSDIRLLAQEVSAGVLNVLKRSGERAEDVPNHPFELLYASPNEHMTGPLLMQYTMYWMGLRGKAFWFLSPRKGNRRDLAEIWPLQADRVEIEVGKDKFVNKYIYRVARGSRVELDPAYVVFFRYPNPFNLWDGLAPLSAAILAMQTDLAEARWQRDTFTTGRGIPHSVILLDKSMSDRDFEVAASRIREDFENERKVAIARGGDLKVEQVGISPRELDLISSREFTRDEIDTVFLGVPFHRVVSETGLAAADKIFKEKSVYPAHLLLAGQMTTQIIQPFYGEDYFAEFDDVRPQDRSLDIQEFNTYHLAMTFDEARQKLDLDKFLHPSLGWLGGLPFTLATNPDFVLQMLGLARESLSGGGIVPLGTPSLPEANAPQAQIEIEAERGTMEFEEAEESAPQAEFEKALADFRSALGLKHLGRPTSDDPHPSGSPQSVHGRGGATMVGITSARPGKPARDVFEQMRLFEEDLKRTSASNVSVQPGYGAWKDGGEPTWVVSYRGNGEARRLIIETAMKYEQDGVLFMSLCKNPARCSPMSEFVFENGLPRPYRVEVEKALVQSGFTGWTWHRRGDNAVLRTAYVEKWMSISSAEFESASAQLALEFGAVRPTRLEKSFVMVEAVEKSEYNAYLGQTR